jgi:hypothetical protein
MPTMTGVDFFQGYSMSKENPGLSVKVVDHWTLLLEVGLEEGLPPITVAYTKIVQPRGYEQTITSPVTVQNGIGRWELTYPLCDEGSYHPVDRRCDWGMGEYRFEAELLAGNQVMHKASSSLSPLDFMPHTFRGVGPLIGFYSQHLVECAPDRPVYIDTDPMSVSLRTMVEPVGHGPTSGNNQRVTLDVVEAGNDQVVAGPWDLTLTKEVSRHSFSSAGWPRGEYWVRLRRHQDGQPVGAYMVRSVWKEILPSEKEPALRPLERVQPMAGPWGFSKVKNVAFDSDPMQPRPDGWIVSQQQPWETEYLSLKSEEVHFDPEKAEYSLDIAANNVRPRDPIPPHETGPIVCRMVSDDGLHWQRPNVGRVQYQGSTHNNIVGYADTDAEGKPAWPLRSLHQARVNEQPELQPDLEQLSIRFYDPKRDGPVDPQNCFVKTTGWDLLALCKRIDPEVRSHFGDNVRKPEHNLYQAYAVERRGNQLLLLSREPLLRSGSGMDLHHTTESFRYTLEDRSTGIYYYYFRPGAHPYPPHYSPIDNIHQIRRVLAVMWTRDYLHWQRRFVLAPDEEDLVGTQFYDIHLHNESGEAARGSPGSVLAGIAAVDGGRVYFGSVTYYDAKRSQMWPELLWTADFLHWHRFAKRRKMIPNSPPGCHSFGAVRPSGVFAEIGNTWWLTYHGYRLPYKYPSPFKHDGSVEAYKQRNLQFGYAPDFENWDQFYQFCKEGYGINPALAVAPAGRLAHAESVEADRAGELVTTPLLPAGETLVINAAAQTGGSVRVELLDEQGRVLPGFELESCRPMQGDELRHVVGWNGQDLTGLQQRPVRIRFVLDRARLYGYFSN